MVYEQKVHDAVCLKFLVGMFHQCTRLAVLFLFSLFTAMGMFNKPRKFFIKEFLDLRPLCVIAEVNLLNVPFEHKIDQGELS